MVMSKVQLLALKGGMGGSFLVTRKGGPQREGMTEQTPARGDPGQSELCLQKIRTPGGRSAEQPGQLQEHR